MNDILSLIERIDKEVSGVVYPDPRGAMLQEARNALSTLTASPLPDEVEGLTRRLRGGLDAFLDLDARERIASLLEQQARQIKRAAQREQSMANAITQTKARIRELEAEQQSNPYIPLESLQQRIADLKAERDALKDDLRFADARNRELLGVRAKTIEECAQLADNEPVPDGEVPNELHLVPLADALRAACRATQKSIARAIRALSQPAEAGKE